MKFRSSVLEVKRSTYASTQLSHIPAQERWCGNQSFQGSRATGKLSLLSFALGRPKPQGLLIKAATQHVVDAQAPGDRVHTYLPGHGRCCHPNSSQPSPTSLLRPPPLLPILLYLTKSKDREGRRWWREEKHPRRLALPHSRDAKPHHVSSSPQAKSATFKFLFQTLLGTNNSAAPFRPSPSRKQSGLWYLRYLTG